MRAFVAGAGNARGIGAVPPTAASRPAPTATQQGPKNTRAWEGTWEGKARGKNLSPEGPGEGKRERGRGRAQRQRTGADPSPSPGTYSLKPHVLRGLKLSLRVPRLGTLLEPSWGRLGPSWRPLVPSWGPLGSFWGPLGGLLGHLGPILGSSWAVLERREAEKAKTPKSFKHQRKI